MSATTTTSQEVDMPPALEKAASYRTVANRIAARLCRDAIWASDRCNWMGSAMEAINGMWTVTRRSFGPDLYSGTSGIALFLGRVCEATGDRVLNKVIAGAVSHAIAQSRNLSPELRLGYYCGGTGIAAALLELGVKFDRQDWLDHGDSLITSLEHDDVDTQPIDVVSGSAGAIPLLLHFHRLRNSALAMELAIRHGERLLRIAKRHEHGWAWETMPQAKRELLGFSHGAAGIAWALLELYEASGRPEFREGADRAIAYEQHWYDPTRKNWPDFRDHSLSGGTAPAQDIFAMAWCHGAPGIGLARLRAYQLTGEGAYLTQAEDAIASTLASLSDPSALAGSQCLCHGSLGNLELLRVAREILRTDQYDAAISRHANASMSLHEFTNGYWPCGVMGGGETPGLLLGLAGVGHFYLMLAQPAETPSVLIPTMRPNN